jgi:hypothetical protein
MSVAAQLLWRDVQLFGKMPAHTTSHEVSRVSDRQLPGHVSSTATNAIQRMKRHPGKEMERTHRVADTIISLTEIYVK